jgi:hypothetical protein
MKTKSYICAAAIAAFGLNSAVIAAHRPGHSTPTRASQNIASGADAPVSRPMTYPLRAGYTVIRTPLIVGETFTGKRKFISDRGLFQSVEQPAKPVRSTMPQDRGQRATR